MTLAEFLVHLHFEVQKSFLYTATISKEGAQPGSSVVQMSEVEVQIDIPSVFRRELRAFDPKTLKGFPESFRQLVQPLPESGPAPYDELLKKPVQGHYMEVEVVGPERRPDRAVGAELIGRLKVVFRPVLK